MSELSPQIVVVTGTSTSGKTTLYESLRADGDFSGVAFHDIDEHGIPPVGLGPWREYRVEHLMFDAQARLEKGQSTIICGITKPHEVLESTHLKQDTPISFILVEISDEQIEKRLRERVDRQVSDGKWNEALDDAAELIKANFELKRVLHNAVTALRHGYVIDASQLTKQALHDQAKGIMMKERS